MRCLQLSSLLIVLLAACSSPYKGLKPVKGFSEDFVLYKPVFKKEIYRCHVDGKFLFKKFHLSGILFFKNLDEGHTRVVFQNEMGYSFFDFGWDQHDSFRVYSILPQLDKPAVVKTLRKDIELLLMRIPADKKPKIFAADRSVIFRYTLQKGVAYYSVTMGSMLQKIEAANRRPVTTIYPLGRRTPRDLPDSISIVHHKAHFTINAKRIEDNAE